MVRIWTLDEIFRRWPSMWFRIVFESALPTLAALIWGGKALIASGSFFSALTAAGIAFPLVLFVQGQVLRMAKNVRDERDADEFRQSFANIQQALGELRKEPPKASETAATLSRAPVRDQSWEPKGRRWLDLAKESGEDFWGTREFFTQAEEQQKRQQYFTALLLVAIGFERTVRNLAGLVRVDTRLPLFSQAADIGRWLDNKEIGDRIRSLMRLRNLLVHGEAPPSEISKAEAEEAIEQFRRALKLIDEETIKYQKRYDPRISGG